MQRKNHPEKIEKQRNPNNTLTNGPTRANDHKVRITGDKRRSNTMNMNKDNEQIHKTRKSLKFVDELMVCVETENHLCHVMLDDIMQDRRDSAR